VPSAGSYWNRPPNVIGVERVEQLPGHLRPTSRRKSECGDGPRAGPSVRMESASGAEIPGHALSLHSPRSRSRSTRSRIPCTNGLSISFRGGGGRMRVQLSLGDIGDSRQNITHANPLVLDGFCYDLQNTINRCEFPEDPAVLYLVNLSSLSFAPLARPLPQVRIIYQHQQGRKS